MFEESYYLKIEPRLPDEAVSEPGESTGDPQLDATVERMLKEGAEIMDRKYISDVRADLREIFCTPVGNILFRAIRHWAVTIKITPYDGSEGRCNAFEEVDHITDAGVIWPRVRYSPDTFGAEGPCVELSKPGQRAATLFHELVHAFRAISTSSHKKYTYPLLSGGLFRYDNYEEFVAVLLTNIYVSGPGNPHPMALSADHRAMVKMPPELANSFKFFASGSSTFYYVDRFCKENPWLTRAISKVPARFNPLAAYYTDPHRAAGYSQGRFAHERDADGYDDAVLTHMTARHGKKP
jgi:hypothetical protein